MRDGKATSHTHARQEMAVLLKGLGVGTLLDAGADASNFAVDMRQLGFAGLVYSATAKTASRRRVTQDSRGDLHRVVLPSPLTDVEAEVIKLNLEMLPPIVTRAIDAIRIDGRFDATKVLADAAGRLPGLTLVMVDPEASQGLAGPGEEEQKAVAELGFERLSLTSANPRAPAEDVQPGGAAYVRRDLVDEARALLARPDAASPIARGGDPAESGVALDAVVVSLPPRPPKRPYSIGRDVGPDWQTSCHASWIKSAPHVISISEANPVYPDVVWRKVDRKPSLKQIIASLAEEPPPGKGTILLTNADIILGPQLQQLLAGMDPHVFYYCSRLDVTVAEHDPRNLDLLGEYVWGHDAFFLPRATIAAIHSQMLLPAALMIGEPYWDYALPIAALVAGHPIKKFFAKPHPVVHLVHDAVSNLHLAKTERIFLRWARELRLRAPLAVSKLITEFVDAYDYTPGSKDAKSEAMCRVIVSGLP